VENPERVAAIKGEPMQDRRIKDVGTWTGMKALF
jgi:hypothetical protein